jgi:O-antigen ligase
LTLYGEPVDAATGVFANSNHQASLMLVALIASGLLISLDDPSLEIKTSSGKWRLHLGWLLIPIFSIMLLAAMSLAGWALLLPALAMSLLLATGRRRLGALLIFALLVLASVGGVLIAFGPSSGPAGDLQALFQNNRLISLPDILFTLQQFWPVGSGLGTFVPVFKANENLDLVTSAYLNHAHNDLLELLIETGLFGGALLGVALIAILAQLWKASRISSRAQATASLGGASILAILFLHSLIDYPLRADAIAAVAGLAVGLLSANAETIGAGRNQKRPGRKSRKSFGSGLSGSGA